MSEQAVRELVERLKADEEFRAEVLMTSDAEGRLALIREAGYDCSTEEIAALATPLSDEAMAELAAGGGSPTVYVLDGDWGKSRFPA
jgi:predicted ribosomally synthesized peptide with nif11-like leader